MFYQIEPDEHLAFMDPNDRERSAIERWVVGENGMRNSSHVATRLGLHYYCHTLIVDIPWQTFVHSRKKNQGDIDIAFLPTTLKNGGYRDGVTQLSYDYDGLVLVEVKTSVAFGDVVKSRRTGEPHLEHLLNQIAKYYSKGFDKVAILQILIGEPREFFDENGKPLEGIYAWGASSYYPTEAALLEIQEAAVPHGELDVDHHFMSTGSIPGLREGASGSIQFLGPIGHKVPQLTKSDDVRAQLIEKLKEVLPTQWGHPQIAFPTMPVVRVCASCKKFIVDARRGAKCSTCS